MDRVETHPHGPENAEHELKKAYNCVIESQVTYDGRYLSVAGIDPEEVVRLYRRAYSAFRKGDRLLAERWARTVKHLARAYWHEAKIAYLAPRDSELPWLDNAAEEYSLHERSDTTADLVESVAEHVPPGLTEMPEDMKHYLSLARKHLEALAPTDVVAKIKNELLRAEHIKAAHEYGRVLECISLAYEAEAAHTKKAA